MNHSRIILQIALLTALIAASVGSLGGASPAWNVPPQNAFGFRKSSRRRTSPKAAATVTAATKEQVVVPSDNLFDDALIDQDEEDKIRHPRIIPASARAAVVAFVSGAAIGSTRHFFERLTPC